MAIHTSIPCHIICLNSRGQQFQPPQADLCSLNAQDWLARTSQMRLQAEQAASARKTKQAIGVSAEESCIIEHGGRAEGVKSEMQWSERSECSSGWGEEKIGRVRECRRRQNGHVRLFYLDYDRVTQNPNNSKLPWFLAFLPPGGFYVSLPVPPSSVCLPHFLPHFIGLHLNATSCWRSLLISSTDLSWWEIRGAAWLGAGMCISVAQSSIFKQIYAEKPLERLLLQSISTEAGQLQADLQKQTLNKQTRGWPRSSTQLSKVTLHTNPHFSV